MAETLPVLKKTRDYKVVADLKGNTYSVINLRYDITEYSSPVFSNVMTAVAAMQQAISELGGGADLKVVSEGDAE